MPYINRRDADGVETVDSDDNSGEARRLCREYQMADPSAEYYVSSRATREWRDSEREAERPNRVTLSRPVPAYLDSFAGLVPCVVTGGRTDCTGGLTLSVRFTGRRARLPEAYKAGQREDGKPPHRIVPRTAVRGLRAMSGPRIAPYHWPDVSDELATLRGVT